MVPAKYFSDKKARDPSGLLKLMDMIDYGYVDKNRKAHTDINDDFDKKYVLQSPGELLQSKIGVCWDQVEFEREFFRTLGCQFETYAIIYYDDKDYPTHTFLVFETQDGWSWFEHSWGPHRGIHKYPTKQLLLKDVKTKFISSLSDFANDHENLCIYKYDKPKSGLGCLQFYKHCESGENIKI